MSSLRQVGLGVLAAVFSTALIFGSMLLALMEGGDLLALAPIPTLTETPVDTPKPGEPTFTPTLPLPPTATPTTAEPVCEKIPPDWVEREMQPGESMAALAEFYGIALDLLLWNNCLEVYSDIPDLSMVAVPAATMTPTETPTPTQPAPTVVEEEEEASQGGDRCNRRPSSWVRYRVRQGDTLGSIARAHGTTAARLKTANCLDSGNIRAGRTIYVPGYAPKAPKRSATPAPRTPRRTSIPPRRVTAPPAEFLFDPAMPPTESSANPPSPLPYP